MRSDAADIHSSISAIEEETNRFRSQIDPINHASKDFRLAIQQDTSVVQSQLQEMSADMATIRADMSRDAAARIVHLVLSHCVRISPRMLTDMSHDGIPTPDPMAYVTEVRGCDILPV
jgi:hypothetical protein